MDPRGGKTMLFATGRKVSRMARADKRRASSKGCMSASGFCE
jgi:hypothetical protein